MDLVNRNRIYQTLATWKVSLAWADVMYGYLVEGLAPGGMFTSMLANDARGMLQRNHPLNDVQSLKAVSGWISDTVPPQARDSYQNIDRWCDLDNDQRWQHLHSHGLVLSADETTFELLKQSHAELDPEIWYPH